MKSAVKGLLLALMVTACATGDVFQEAAPPSEGKVLVYLMRPMVGGGSFFNTKFGVDGKEIASLTNNGYTWVVLTPGTHKISGQVLKNDPLYFELTATAGSTYYVEMRQGETMDGLNTRRDFIHEVPAATAKPVLAKMRYTLAVSK
jgi:hypothetical protein